MAPGCIANINLQQISTDTVDSFEILEQTVMKQKRLAKKKKCDLRLRILLKRTFDLVCEIMDRENGFTDDYIDSSSNNNSNINNNYSNYSDTEIQQQNPQQHQHQEENGIMVMNTTTTTTTTSSSSSSTITITTIERAIESIPLPPEDEYNNSVEIESNNIQMVPDDDTNVIEFNENKEYHMLTNVQTDFFNNNEKTFKRKYSNNNNDDDDNDEDVDENDNYDVNNNNNNNTNHHRKKFKLVDLIGGSSSSANKVQFVICF